MTASRRSNAAQIRRMSDEKSSTTARQSAGSIRGTIKGYIVGIALIVCAVAMVASLDELRRLVGLLDAAQPFPVGELGTPRGRQGGPRSKVVLPHGWYDDTGGCGLDLSDAEDGVSGG